MTSLGRDSRGAGFAEYLVLVGAVALFGLGAYRVFGSSVQHKAATQAEAVDGLSAAPATAEDRGGSAIVTPNDDGVSASEPGEAEGEGTGWTVAVFFAALVIAGGIVIATVGRPRHAPSDGESGQSS